MCLDDDIDSCLCVGNSLTTGFPIATECIGHSNEGTTLSLLAPNVRFIAPQLCRLFLILAPETEMSIFLINFQNNFSKIFIAIYQK